jgi:hypothetical protein
MTSKKPHTYASIQPDPERGLNAAERKVRRELIGKPKPVTFAAKEIAKLRTQLGKDIIDWPEWPDPKDLS